MGWDGSLHGAPIENSTDKEPEHAPFKSPVTVWVIQREGDHLWLRRMPHSGGLPPLWDTEPMVGPLEELCALVPPGLRHWAPDDPTKTPVVESWG